MRVARLLLWLEQRLLPLRIRAALLLKNKMFNSMREELKM
jgi:hypothetical protein